jgi:hypothetical protein
VVVEREEKTKRAEFDRAAQSEERTHTHTHTYARTHNTPFSRCMRAGGHSFIHSGSVIRAEVGQGRGQAKSRRIFCSPAPFHC